MILKALVLTGVALSFNAQADLGARIQEGMSAVQEGNYVEADRRFTEAQAELSSVRDEGQRANLEQNLEELRRALGEREWDRVGDRAERSLEILDQDPDRKKGPPHQGPQRPEPPRQDPPRHEPPRRPEPPRHEPPRPPMPPRHEPPRHEPPRPPMPPRHEPPRHEPPRHEPPRPPMPPRHEPPRHEPPRPPMPPRPFPPYRPPYYERFVECSSEGGQYTECDAGVWVDAVTVESQHSRSDCSYGRTYGTLPQNPRWIWVSGGCRALFRVMYR